MVHLSLYWRTQHKAAYGITTDAKHLMEFEFWGPILILDDKTHFTNSQEIFCYHFGPAPNKGDIDYSWVCNE